MATAAGGNPEIVLDGETGLLVRVGDLSGLAAGIRRLLQERELVVRLVAAAAARARSEFSQDRYRRLLLRFYAEAFGSVGATAEYSSPKLGRSLGVLAEPRPVAIVGSGTVLGQFDRDSA